MSKAVDTGCEKNLACQMMQTSRSLSWIYLRLLIKNSNQPRRKLLRKVFDRTNSNKPVVGVFTNDRLKPAAEKTRSASLLPDQQPQSCRWCFHQRSVATGCGENTFGKSFTGPTATNLSLIFSPTIGWNWPRRKLLRQVFYLTNSNNPVVGIFTNDWLKPAA